MNECAGPLADHNCYRALETVIVQLLDLKKIESLEGNRKVACRVCGGFSKDNINQPFISCRGVWPKCSITYSFRIFPREGAKAPPLLSLFFPPGVPVALTPGVILRNSSNPVIRLKTHFVLSGKYIQFFSTTLPWDLLNIQPSDFSTFWCIDREVFSRLWAFQSRE